MGDLGLIPGLGRSPGKGKGYPVQYSDLKNSIDCVVQGVPRGINNRTEVSVVLEEGVRVSSDISVIVDHPTSASFSLGSK